MLVQLRLCLVELPSAMTVVPVTVRAHFLVLLLALLLLALLLVSLLVFVDFVECSSVLLRLPSFEVRRSRSLLCLLPAVCDSFKLEFLNDLRKSKESKALSATRHCAVLACHHSSVTNNDELARIRV